MRLRELLSVLPAHTVLGEADGEIRGICHDSRTVRPGDLFCAVPGQRYDGHAFVAEAVARGAAAVLVERPVEVSVPQIVVPSVRRALGPLASALYGHPSRHLRVIGVTGTNGKGTVTYLLRAVLEAGGMPCGVIGSLGAVVGSEVLPLPLTTPEASDLHALFHRMVQSGLRFAAVEVASHALAQERVGGVRFAAAAFTNLTQDHLDFHGTFEAYRNAKALLFERVESDGICVINREDPAGAYMASRSRAPVLLYGFGQEAHVRAENVSMDLRETTFIVRTLRGRARFWLPLCGIFNVLNALCAIALGEHFGVPLDAMADALRHFPGLPGRFERVDEGQDFAVIVDYAHTPDSLRAVLETARQVAPGRVVVVFGCGGDRDPTKRPVMGRVASERADLVVLTSDNPRTEDPLRILQQIHAGVTDGARCVVEPDRRAAIQLAIAEARTGDVVLICGKGHETYQIVGTRRIPLDDREEARKALRMRGYGRP
ncbi:MAG: UDP-N-acetylmuramoyl-L-alanyl-D-glutamate--2,6-diaminopimelate ligase [Armatimonadota bacterium]|nr:UDP-N-acetylmuramoyl-L-alanyl-D-glutamate--2,6-diaminopimelate ligase [Armatimonadota bacterium]MDR7563670.1 UDP-N-acetylmuramoyl-L-alanyl-D-glutamate--2,6-diaminopimelate ligase [Armatimonadota bacterium]MDR7566771.1 UDP-N-acetylmuramoyl-L-alanyl-D-glutamate--2,6-diaminopimelate ligase [Armatimonadota bacterium]